jgi:hypothetical protein
MQVNTQEIFCQESLTRTFLLQKQPKIRRGMLVKIKSAVSLALISALVISVMAGTQLAHFASANFFPDPGPDLPRIYIRNDGSVEPATAPIERTGNHYKLTDNIVLYTIEIQRDNIVLDGSGHLIQGNASWLGYDAGNNGVIVAGRDNVTITRLNIAQCYAGVRISDSSRITVVDGKIPSKGN